MTGSLIANKTKAKASPRQVSSRRLMAICGWLAVFSTLGFVVTITAARFFSSQRDNLVLDLAQLCLAAAFAPTVYVFIFMQRLKLNSRHLLNQVRQISQISKISSSVDSPEYKTLPGAEYFEALIDLASKRELQTRELSLLLKICPDAIFVLDSNAHLQLANPAAELICKRETSHMLGTAFAEFFVEEDRGKITSAINKLLADAPSQSELYCSLSWRSGRATPVLLSMTGCSNSSAVVVAREMLAVQQKTQSRSELGRLIHASFNDCFDTLRAFMAAILRGDYPEISHTARLSSLLGQLDLLENMLLDLDGVRSREAALEPVDSGE